GHARHALRRSPDRAFCGPLWGRNRRTRSGSLSSTSRARAGAPRSPSVLPTVPSALLRSSLEESRVEVGFAVGRYAVSCGSLARSDHLAQLGAGEVKGDVVVGGDTRGESSSDELLVDGTAPLFTVVVRAGASREKAEADHSRAPAGQKDALL